MTDTNARGRLAALALVAALTFAIAGLGLAAAEVVSSSDVYLDDPDNETVEVDVDYQTDDTDATAELLNESGDVVDNETINADDGDTETFELEPGDVEPGEYEVNLTTNDAADVERAETRLIAERDVTVDDAGNETLAVDAGFASDENATASVAVDDADGSQLLRDTIEYDAGEYDDNETVVTREFNDSDGVEDGNLTVSVETEPASAYDGAWASVDSGDDSIFGGTIAGQDTTVVVAIAAIAGVVWYGRKEDWF